MLKGKFSNNKLLQYFWWIIQALIEIRIVVSIVKTIHTLLFPEKLISKDGQWQWYDNDWHYIGNSVDKIGNDLFLKFVRL